MRRAILLTAVLSATCYAQDWNFTSGISTVFYPKTQDNLWWDAPYNNIHTERNFGIMLGGITKVSPHWNFKLGYFQPQTHYVNAQVPADTTTPPYYCLQNCGALGSINVKTRMRGMYFLASPEYGDTWKVYADLGGWVFHQTVEAYALNIPRPDGSAYGWHVSSSANSVRPVFGLGVKYKSISVSLAKFNCGTAGGDALPAGFASPIKVLTISKEW